MYLKKVLKIEHHEIEVLLECTCGGNSILFVDNTETSFTEQIPKRRCKNCGVSEVQKLRGNY